MTFLEFSKVFGDQRIIDIRDVCTYFNGMDRRRLYEWQTRGLLKKVTSNFYVMTNRSVDSQGLKTIACRIYAPAYIGLASALTWYNFIPEAVFHTTAITTRRPRTIRTGIGDFFYRSISPSLFFGMNVVESEKDRFFISDPEKTLLDFLYFTAGSDRKDKIGEMRLNLSEIRRRIDDKKLLNYLDIFDSPKLDRSVRILSEMKHAES